MNRTPNNISRSVEEALLVIAGDDPSEGEARIKQRLEQIGFEAFVKSAAGVQPSDAGGVNVVVICSGATAAAVNTKFNDVAVPVVVLNHELFKPMRMARKPKKGIPYQGIPDQTSVRILDIGHPMAAGLADDVPVCDPTTIFWAEPHHTALKIASDALDGSRLVWFAYERGSDLIPRRAKSPRSANRSPQENGTRAQSHNAVVGPNPVALARRVGLFFSDRVARHATPEGWSLFGSAVCWAAGREALLVVGSVRQMSEGDRNIRGNLQKFGYAVTVKENHEASRSDAKRKAVMVVSATVGLLRREFRDAEVPILVLRANLFAELGMTSEMDGDYGEVASQTSVKIVKGGHPMVAGRSGIVVVSQSGQYLNWGSPAAAASRIATQDGSPTRTVIFGYKAGVEMFGLKAPARRVGFFLSDGVAENSTAEGWELFAAAIAWAVDSKDKEVLFVVGSNQETTDALAEGDRRIKMRLEGLCYSVTISGWESVEESDLDGKSLVVISSSVDALINADPNAYNFAHSNAPVLCMSADAFPLLGMTGAEAGIDYGREDATAIEITDPHHSMAAGLQGFQKLSAEAVPMAWGNPRSRNVIRVASHEWDQDNAALFGYEANKKMPGGRSPSRRVGFCFSVSLAEVSSDVSWKLFDAAVNWAAGLGVMEFRDVFIEEWQEVLERRARFFDERAARSRCSAPENLVGLALSGGGIRSATFSLGLLQGLDELGLLRIFDYLSTVSGGGYLGGWWSAWLSRHGRKGEDGLLPNKEEVKANEMSLVRSGDTLRKTVIVTRNLVITSLVMLPILIGFVLLGQLYFVLQANSISDFLFPYWQENERVLNQRKDYANDFVGASSDKEKQDKFEQTAEYLAAKTGSDYKEVVALLRREIAGEPPEDFSQREAETLSSFSGFLYGDSRSSEIGREFDDLVSFIKAISGDGYKSIARQLDEYGFRYISKDLPPRPEYDQRKEELGSLIEYFNMEDASASLSFEPDVRDADVSIRDWLQSLAQPITNHALDSETQAGVEVLANYLSAISQKRIIDLRKGLIAQSLDAEQTKIVDNIMAEATKQLRQKHQSDLRDRAVQAMLPLLPLAGWIVLMNLFWMRTARRGSRDRVANFVAGAVVVSILLCVFLLFTFPVSEILPSLNFFLASIWRRQYLLMIGIWLGVAICLWLYIRTWSIRRSSNSDRAGAEDGREEVSRNKTELVQSTLVVSLLIGGAVLLLSGFGHELVNYIWFDPLPKKWLADYVSTGGWAALIAAIAGSIYTGVKTGPISSEGGSKSGDQRLINRLIFSITPPLLVLLTAVFAAWATHELFVWLTTAQIGTLATRRFPPLTVAILLGVTLCLISAVGEIDLRKSRQPIAAFFSLWVIEIIGGFIWYSRLNLRLSWELPMVLIIFVLAVGGLIFFRLLVSETDGVDPTGRSGTLKRFQPRVFRDLFASKGKLLAFLGVCSVVLPMLALWPVSRLLPEVESRVSGLGICWLVGITLCLTFSVFEIVIGKGDNRRSLWLVAAVYLLLLVLFLFSLYGDYRVHSSVMLGHIALGLVAMTFTWIVALASMVDPNRLSQHTFYKWCLVRGYLGASNGKRREQVQLTAESEPGDDLLLHHLRNCPRGAPYHILNTTLGPLSGHRSTARHSFALFTLSKRYCGSLPTGYRNTEDYMNGRITLGTALAVSGAGSRSMGAPGSTASLAMLRTLLNLRLGYWAPTPNKEAWRAERARLWPFYILHGVMSRNDDLATYCYLNDGGHFDNTGLYSLVARACRYIVVVDSSQNLGDTISRCGIDFGAQIRLDLTPLFKSQVEGESREYSKQHFVAGTIVYSVEHVRRLKWAGDIEDFNRRKGVIVIIKPALVRDEPVDIRQYGLENDTFPQQATSDQWFDEPEFESYRRLGQLSAHRAFSGVPAIENDWAISLYDVEQIFEGLLQR